MEKAAKSSRGFSLLQGVFLFRGIPPETVRSLYFSPECRCMLFSENERIYTRSVYQKCLGIVLSGQLRAVKTASDGSSVLMNTFLRGGVFGAAGLFTESRQYVSEIIAVKKSKVLFLPEEILRTFFQEEPRSAENYIAFLSGRIRFLNTRIDHFTGGSAKGRLISFLLSLPLKSPGDVVELPCSMTRLADVLDIGRASLYRAFDILREEGSVRRSKSRLVELDLEKLKNGALPRP